MVTVFAPGTKVRLRTPDIKDAEVTEVHVMHENHVTYSVVWWTENTRTLATVEASEIEVHENEIKTLTIGFGCQEDKK